MGAVLPPRETLTHFSMHSNALNFAVESGPLVSLVTDPQDMTVSSIAIRDDELALILATAPETGIISQHSLSFPRRGHGATVEVIWTSRTTVFHGRIVGDGAGYDVNWERRAHDLIGRLRRLAEREATSSLLPILWDRPSRTLQPVVLKALTAVHDSKTETALATRLVGLGPGMTPSGDDFLVGYLAGLWITGQAKAARRMANSVRGLSGRTTRAGSTILLHAADAHFPAYLVAALRALGDGETDDAIRIARSQGATSGLDALTGLITSIIHRERESA